MQSPKYANFPEIYMDFEVAISCLREEKTAECDKKNG